MAFNVFFSSSFNKELKRIAKKHRKILADISLLVDSLSEDPTIGTDLGKNVRKIRLSITGTAKGKSGGARVITYVKLNNDSVIMAEIYLKNEYETVNVDTIIDRLSRENLL